MTESTTFKKYEEQQKMSAMLSQEFIKEYADYQEEHDQYSMLEKLEDDEKERLHKFYLDIGKKFPRYKMKLTHENLQRCIIKCAKIDCIY